MLAEMTRSTLPQREERRYSIKKKENRNKVAQSFQRKRAAFILSLTGGMVVLSIILLSAVASSIAFSNNMLSKENKELKNDLQRLNVAMQEGSSRSQIEIEAEAKLGMIHPTSAQFVTMDKTKAPENFADKLKEEAFK